MPTSSFKISKDFLMVHHEYKVRTKTKDLEIAEHDKYAGHKGVVHTVVFHAVTESTMHICLGKCYIKNGTNQGP